MSKNESDPAVRESEARYRLHYEATPAMLHSIDEHGRIVLVSDHWLKVLGYARHEVVGHRSTEFLTEASQQFAVEVILPEFFRQGFCTDVPYQFVRKDGGLVDILLSATSERNEEGRVLRSRAVLVDVTERKKAQTALSQSEANLLDAQRIAHLGSWEWDLQQDTMWWSHELHRILGFDVGTTVPSFEALLSTVPESEHRTFEHAVEAAKTAGAKTEFECRIHRPDGMIRTVHVRMGATLGESGTPVRVACTLQDISERRALEEQLLHSQKLEAVGRLAGGVAHDFNNVLQSIFASADLVLSVTSGADPRRRNLQLLLDSAERAAALVRQLLAFSRPQMLQSAPLQLNVLIEGLVTMLRRVIGEDVELELSTAPALCVIEADAVQLEQVLMNLCINARDAMPEGGTLTIETRNLALTEPPRSDHSGIPAGEYVLLTVSDTGHGMDEATRQRIFEPFYTTKSAGSGSGLGLATVFEIIKHHGGVIGVHSEVGQGTRFRIYLPQAAGSAVAALEQGEGVASGGKGLILIAEDDISVRTALAEALSTAGYQILQAADGEEAVGIFSQDPDAIDLVVLDAVMPKLSGAGVFEQMCAIRPDVRVLCSSGYDPEMAHTRFIRDRQLPLIQKPYRVAELLRRVAELLE